jgi:FkbM family methyltransferase
MQDVGESAARNREYRSKFSREILIKSLIDPRLSEPMVFDVGAHKGESVRYLRNLFPGAVIHSFEPFPAAFAELRALGDEHTHPHNLAVSDTDGMIEFFHNNISHTNSLFRINERSKDSLFMEERRRSGAAVDVGTFNRPLHVTSTRLTTFCSQHGIERIELLKLDVQGAERKILEGASGLLRHVESIIVEIMLFDYYEHQGSFLEIESILYPAGHRLFAISEISNNPMNGRTDWVEAIYRRGGAP